MVFVRDLDRSFADGSFYEDEASPFYLSDEKLRGDYSPVRYRREIRLLTRRLRAGSVLDVGCSTGGFLYHLDREHPGNYRIFGADVPSKATRFAAGKGIKILDGDFLKQPPKPAFDAITFWAVLEHVADPGRFLAQAKRLLGPGGICIALAPNFESFAVRLLGARYRYILPQHINYFSIRTLVQLFRNAGFEIMETTTTHFNPFVIWQDFRRKEAVEMVADSERARLLGQTNAMKQSTALAPLRLAYNACEKVLGTLGLADNAVVVAKKPSED